MKLFYFLLLACLGFLLSPALANDAAIKQAYLAQQSDLQVQGIGKVIKVLSDDTKGSKHQRFILRLGSKQTLLIAHNIDLAPKIPNLKQGDTIAFYGEYEYNKKGGIVHWTHKDPRNNHAHGWLKHKEITYQ